MPSSLNGTGITFNDATTLQSGDIPVANLGSGTANSTTFLAGDRTWKTVSVSPSSAQVLTAFAGASFGGVGTLSETIGGVSATAFGSTTAGGNLPFVDGSGNTIYPMSGTWRNVGPRANSGSLCWLRVS